MRSADICDGPDKPDGAAIGDIAVANNSVQIEERGTIYSLTCETGTGNLLIATDTTRDMLPLRIRGTA